MQPLCRTGVAFTLPYRGVALNPPDPGGVAFSPPGDQRSSSPSPTKARASLTPHGGDPSHLTRHSPSWPSGSGRGVRTTFSAALPRTHDRQLPKHPSLSICGPPRRGQGEVVPANGPTHESRPSGSSTLRRPFRRPNLPEVSDHVAGTTSPFPRPAFRRTIRAFRYSMRHRGNSAAQRKGTR